MAEFPALPLFTDAYIADTAHLTNEEHGVYLRLLMFAWRTPACALPDNDARLALMVGVTKGKWAKLKPTIMSFWTLSENGYVQKKLTSQRDFVSKQREQKVLAGKASAESKRLKALKEGSTAVEFPLVTAGQQPISKPITTVKRDTKVSPKKPLAKSRMLECWVPSKENREYAIEKGIHESMVDTLAEEFRIYWSGRTDRDGAKTDDGWRMTWQGNVRRCATRPEYSKQLNGGYNANGNHHNGTPKGGKRPDPALEQIARLAGIGRA